MFVQLKSFPFSVLGLALTSLWRDTFSFQGNVAIAHDIDLSLEGFRLYRTHTFDVQRLTESDSKRTRD